MPWQYAYDDDENETTVYYSDNKIGVVDGKLTEWKNGVPSGDVENLIKKAVDDPMVVDLLYGFEEIRDE